MYWFSFATCNSFVRGSFFFPEQYCYHFISVLYMEFTMICANCLVKTSMSRFVFIRGKGKTSVYKMVSVDYFLSAVYRQDQSALAWWFLIKVLWSEPVNMKPSVIAWSLEDLSRRCFLLAYLSSSSANRYWPWNGFFVPSSLVLFLIFFAALFGVPTSISFSVFMFWSLL